MVMYHQPSSSSFLKNIGNHSLTTKIKNTSDRNDNLSRNNPSDIPPNTNTKHIDVNTDRSPGGEHPAPRRQHIIVPNLKAGRSKRARHGIGGKPDAGHGVHVRRAQRLIEGVVRQRHRQLVARGLLQAGYLVAQLRGQREVLRGDGGRELRAQGVELVARHAVREVAARRLRTMHAAARARQRRCQERGG